MEYSEIISANSSSSLRRARPRAPRRSGQGGVAKYPQLQIPPNGLTG